jgi:hypothetical protein
MFFIIKTKIHQFDLNYFLFSILFMI